MNTRFDIVDGHGHASVVDLQLALRAPPELIARVDALAVDLSVRASGSRVTRSDAARIVLARGLDALELEFGLGLPAAGGER